MRSRILLVLMLVGLAVSIALILLQTGEEESRLLSTAVTPVLTVPRTQPAIPKSQTAVNLSLTPQVVPAPSSVNPPPVAPSNRQEWLVLTRLIRDLPPGPEKDEALGIYMRIRESSLSKAIVDTLLAENDPALRDHHILLLQMIANGDGVQHLVDRIDAAKGKPAQQELLLRVFENLNSKAAMSALRGIAVDPAFTSKEPLLFNTLRSLARSGDPEDVKAIFDRIDKRDPANRQELSLFATAVVETANLQALPFLLDVATGRSASRTDTARLLAVYTLRNYRDDPEAHRLLIELQGNGDPTLSQAATEALEAPR